MSKQRESLAEVAARLSTVPVADSEVSVSVKPTGFNKMTELERIGSHYVGNQDSRGRVPVFVYDSGSWVWRYPVDVREIVSAGSGTILTSERTGSMPKAV